MSNAGEVYGIINNTIAAREARLIEVAVAVPATVGKEYHSLSHRRTECDGYLGDRTDRRKSGYSIF